MRRLRAARQFMYHCAWRVTQGHDIVQDVSMLKALTGELVNEVVQACQQFHGGMGYMRETADRAALARRPRAGHRRRRNRSDAGRSRETILRRLSPQAMVFLQRGGPMTVIASFAFPPSAAVLAAALLSAARPASARNDKLLLPVEPAHAQQRHAPDAQRRTS